MSYIEFKVFLTPCWTNVKFEIVVISKECGRDNGRYRYICCYIKGMIITFHIILCSSMSGETILHELIKSKENIKRTYFALKQSEAEIQYAIVNTFEPVIDSLIKIQEQT